jgi:hypothetical protein
MGGHLALEPSGASRLFENIKEGRRILLRHSARYTLKLYDLLVTPRPRR